MNATAYTYCVVRYVHDPSAGEQLNIGVLMYAPDVPFVGAIVERRYERLSKVFANFDGDHYRRVLAQFEAAVQSFRDLYLGDLHEMWTPPKDAGSIGCRIWPDTDLSFQIGPVLAGVTNDPAQTLDATFARMVTSQHEKPETVRRSDDDIWAVYQRPLNSASVTRVLKPQTFTTDDIELTFDHTFRNGTYRALLPISMDLIRPESMRDKATRWLGYSVALRGVHELSKIYILLGRPQLESHLTAYLKAKNLLHKMEILHEFVEEGEAEAFAVDLRNDLKSHGLLERVDGTVVVD
jgi:hypothetical protein